MLAIGGVLITARRRAPRTSDPQYGTRHQEGTGDLGRGPDTKSNLL